MKKDNKINWKKHVIIPNTSDEVMNGIVKQAHEGKMYLEVISAELILVRHNQKIINDKLNKILKKLK